MERASSRKDLRTERLGRGSPYARPEKKSQRSRSSAPFATIKNIYSYFTSPFARSETHSTLPTHAGDIDQRSESGSEDGWNGNAPAQSDGQDVFHLAAAAGRHGQAFDDRAAEWRAKGEKEGGRRETARRQIEPTAPSSKPVLKSPTMPGHLVGYKGIPSLPALSSTNTHKRPLSPNHLPARSPLPSFLPPSPKTAPSVSSAILESASSAALATFLEAKKGQQMTTDDIRVIESLTASIKTESVIESQRKQDFKTGGWSAGMFASTPRPTKPSSATDAFDSVNLTPAGPTDAFGTPGAAFSLGMTPAPAGSTSSSPRRITYLGPGMSPRRMLPKARFHKPLFDLDFSTDESASNKRRKGEVDMGDGNSTEELARDADGLSSSASIPTPPTVAKNVSNPSENAITIGKKRAADIMKELIGEEIGEMEEKRQPEYMVINPYDTESPSSRSAPTPSKPNTPIRARSPRKSVLRSSLRGKETPKRGAAAKLEMSRSGRKLTTLEILQGKRPWSETTSPSLTEADRSTNELVRNETPSREDDEMEIDAYFDKTPSRPPAQQRRLTHKSPSPSPVAEPAQKSSKISPPEPFAPYAVPTLNSSTQPIPSVSLTSSFGQSFPSPSQDSAIASSQRKAQPKFTPSPLSTSIASNDFDEPESQHLLALPLAKKGAYSGAIYLPAKDTALKIDPAALPFFTFSLTTSIQRPSDETRSAVINRPIEVFSFTLLDLVVDSSGPPPPRHDGQEWTCDTCMLKNPPTATTKCYICDTARPASVPTFSFGSSTPIPKKAGPKSEGEWRCDLCMLKNPGSAKEKCLICDAKRS